MWSPNRRQVPKVHGAPWCLVLGPRTCAGQVPGPTGSFAERLCSKANAVPRSAGQHQNLSRLREILEKRGDSAGKHLEPIRKESSAAALHCVIFTSGPRATTDNGLRATDIQSTYINRKSPILE